MLEDLLPYIEKGEATYALKGYRGLNVAGKLKFTKILVDNHNQLNSFHKKAIQLKECYVGPFIGEFGNFLLHMLPFISYLHKQDVKIHYCGMANQTPFLIDESGSSLLFEFVELRDFFHEVRPSGNSIEFLPEDVDIQVKGFQKRGNEGLAPYLDIFSNSNLYWYSYRNWQLKGKQHVYNLSNHYGPGGKKNKAVIFPRKMSSEFTPNNGGNWDYNAISEILKKYFEEVVFIGHPSMSAGLDNVSSDRVTLALSADNKNVLQHCSTAKLVITQHSGAMHVSGYTQSPVLLIFNGKPPIKGLDDSIRYRKNFEFRETDISFGYEEIEGYCKKLSGE